MTRNHKDITHSLHLTAILYLTTHRQRENQQTSRCAHLDKAATQFDCPLKQRLQIMLCHRACVKVTLGTDFLCQRLALFHRDYALIANVALAAYENDGCLRAVLLQLLLPLHIRESRLREREQKTMIP